MQQFDAAVQWAPLVFLVALSAVVIFKLISGSISLSGLLTGERTDGSSYFSFGRAQLLVFTLVVAAQYAREVTAHPSLKQMPDLQMGTVGALAGSQFFYLAGKARALWFRTTAKPSSKGEN